MAADFDPQALDDLIAAMRANTGAVSDMTANFERQQHRSRGGARMTLQKDLEQDQKAKKSFRKSMNDAGEVVSDTFTTLGGNTSALADRMRLLRDSMPGGALFGGLIAWGKNTIDTYRDMANVGQTFNGSMFDLAAAAANAGLPLDEFAKTLRDNAKSVAVFGSKAVTGLMLNVRKTSEQYGLYGYSVEQLNDVTGKYIEMQRVYGNRYAASNTKTIKSVTDLAKQVGGVAAATGVAREQILEGVMKAMTDVAFTSRTIGMAGADVQAFSDTALKAVTLLSGLPGEAGSTFSTFLSQTLGYGTSLFSDAANDFIEAGLGSMLGSIDSLATAINANSGDIEGATWGMISEFKTTVEAQREGLRVQAMAGNASAKRILQMYDEVRNLTQAEYDRKKKDAEAAKPLTALLLSLGSIFKRLMGTLVGGIFGKLGDVEKAMTSFVDGPVFEAMEGVFKKWGESIGSMLAKIGPEEVRAWAFTFEQFVNAVMVAAGAVAGIGIAVTQTVDFLKTAGDALMSPIVAVAQMIDKVFNTEFAGSVKGVSGLLATLAAVLGGFMIFKGVGGFLKGMFSNQNTAVTNIRAGQVFVNTMGGLLGGGGGFGGGPAGKAGKAGRLGMLGRFLGVGGAAAAMGGGAMAAGAADDLLAGGGALARGTGNAGAKGLGKIGAKGLAGMVGKKLPFGLGLGIALAMAASSAKSGDWIGAGGNALSGLAAIVPGIGTAASLGIDAALMARDSGVLPKGEANWFKRDPTKDASRNADAAMSSVERSASKEDPNKKTKAEIEAENMVKQFKETSEQLIALNRDMLATMRRLLTTNQAILTQQQ